MPRSVPPVATGSLAALVAAPALTLVAHLVQVTPDAHDTASELESIAAHADRYQLSGTIGFLSMVLFVPAFLALAQALRAHRPRLAGVGLAMSLVGLMGLTSLMGSGPMSLAMAQAPERAAMVRVTDVYESLPLTNIWVVLMLLGSLGPVVLGFGLWRSGLSLAIPALLVGGLVVQMMDAGRWPLALAFALTTAGMTLAAFQLSVAVSRPAVREPARV